jgi:transcriptional regulator with XRE-family HTH domain
MIPSVPYDRVASISWDKQAGERLKKLRNDKRYSRGCLARLTQDCDQRLSEAYIQKVEDGRAKTIRRAKLETLLSLLDSDIQAVFPGGDNKKFS